MEITKMSSPEKKGTIEGFLQDVGYAFKCMAEQKAIGFLPCPFCGGDKINWRPDGMLIYGKTDSLDDGQICAYVIYCLDCGANAGPGKFKYHAKELWNTRK